MAGDFIDRTAGSGVPAAFARRFSEHNRQVISVAAVLALVALGFWTVAYLAVYLLTALCLTIFDSLDAGVPASFPVWFAIGAVFSLVLARAARQWLATPTVREQVPRRVRWLVEIALAGPMMTVSVAENIAAFRWLGAREMRQAWEILHRIGKAGAISLGQLPVYITDARSRERILTALQITNLVVVRQQGSDWLVALRDNSARKLSQAGVRLDTARCR